MIRYQLQCKAEHIFDGWFKNSKAYDTQAAAGHITCPVCGSTDVSKALMAPNIGARFNVKGDTPVPPAQDTNGPDAADTGATSAPTPAPAASAASPSEQSAKLYAMQREVVEVMRKVRKQVEETAEYVGPRFAEEARKIHHEESKPRGIYGEASEEDVAELTEEGIDFLPLPRLPEDNN